MREEIDLLIYCNDGQRSNGLNRRFRTAAVGVVWLTALAVVLGSGLPVVAAEEKEQSIKERAADDATNVQVA